MYARLALCDAVYFKIYANASIGDISTLYA